MVQYTHFMRASKNIMVIYAGDRYIYTLYQFLRRVVCQQPFEGQANGPTYKNGTALIFADWEWWFTHQFDDNGHATVQGDLFDPRLQQNINRDWQQSLEQSLNELADDSHSGLRTPISQPTVAQPAVVQPTAGVPSKAPAPQPRACRTMRDPSRRKVHHRCWLDPTPM